MTVVPERTFVNFIILAESVALAPMVDFCASLEVFSIFEVDEFRPFEFALLLGLFGFCTSSCVRSKNQAVTFSVNTL